MFFLTSSFNGAIDLVMEHTVGLNGLEFEDHGFKDLDYADDIMLPVFHHTVLHTVSKTMGLDVS